MKVTVLVTLEADDAPTVVHEVFSLSRGPLAPGNLGLGLDEAKGLLAAVQERMVNEQVKTELAAQGACPECGAARRHKDSRTIVVRSLFGTLHLASPRWWHCACTPQATSTFSPLTAMLPERTLPEMVYLEAKFAGLASYGLSAKLLGEVLPLGRPLHATAVRLHTQAVAQRLEDELGDEHFGFIDTCQRDRDALPRPDLPLVVGLDGGYVHSAQQRSRRDGWFEVIAGRSTPAEGPSKCFGFVQTYDTKPKRRLYDLLEGQGMAANQAVTFITDGGDDVRDLPLYLYAGAEHLLDWFHVTMRLTVMANIAKGLDGAALADKRGAWSADLDDVDLAHLGRLVARIPDELSRLKWFCWHGNVFRALQITNDLHFDLEPLRDVGPAYAKLYRTVTEFDTYLRANAGSLPNYGERYRAGEPISSSMAESAVNQVIAKRMVKNQQMRWSPRGAHMLVQVRTRVLNDDLADDFRRWHPGFTHTPTKRDKLPAAA